MDKKQKIIISAVIVLIAIAGIIWFKNKNQSGRQQIDLSPKKSARTGPLNTGDVSPISGLACENWKNRPIAVMQPADVLARPAAGFSQADMVIEMPGFTASATRLLGVYLCNIPNEIGAIRSSRHDYIALAKGLDSIFIHWGGSAFALELLKQNVIDHVDCITSDYCARWDWQNDPKMRMEDSGHITKESIQKAMTDKSFSNESKFSGYPHREEAPLEERPSGGHLRVAFAKPYDVEYDYDKQTNSWLRTWSETPDTDRNNQQRLAPKNVVVMMAKSEQIRLDIDYKARGVQSPWDLIPESERAGINDVPGAPGIGRYNNVEIGDPWYDAVDNGEAFFYIDGKETKGTWKKDKSSIDSKLTFYDQSGQEVMFIPGQIWVEILEPGQALKWVPTA